VPAIIYSDGDLRLCDSRLLCFDPVSVRRIVDVSTTSSYSAALGSVLPETTPFIPPVDQHKNRLNHQKLENCEPERKAADFRLSTRPFLSLVEKKWLAFQLLLAVKQCHEKGICHGDIKCENVLVTSWNWLYLADFASFKPTYIPYDDPSDFSFFYDTRERRLCYLAPEVL
ncbi:unnamed protein product, partial [Brassica rapa]